MNRITIACPACGRSGSVDEGAVPDRPMRLKCPQCQGTFTFTKGTGAPSAPSGSVAVPAAPQRTNVPPPKPSGGRPASAPSAKAPAPARDRRRSLVAMGALAGGAVVLVASSIYVFKLAPIAAEKLLIAALFSKVPPVQWVAIRALRDHPTKHAAIALVAFVNLKNLQEVEDPKKPWTPEEKARRRERRVRDLALAERATETLCLLTGQSFGTYFKLEPHGYSWGSLSEARWPTVLWQIDAWALQTFGTGELPLLAHSHPAVAHTAWLELWNLYFTKWMVYQAFPAHLDNAAPISFLIERESFPPGGDNAPAMEGFFARNKPIYFKTERLYARTVGEALMAIMYREKKWTVDFQGDWRAWWQANGRYYR